MNRAERRDFVKKARQKGISKEVAEVYLVAKALGIRNFDEDDKVRLKEQPEWMFWNGNLIKVEE